LRVADLLWADVPLPAALRSLGLDPPPLGVAMVAQSGRTAIERMCRPLGDAVVAQSGRTAVGDCWYTPRMLRAEPSIVIDIVTRRALIRRN
jgi:hypothetical protein